MLNVKYVYDETTTATIENFENALAEYEKILRAQIDKRSTSHTTVGERSRLFLTDAGRVSLINQLVRIKEMSIPIEIEFTGIPDDYKAVGHE